MHRKPRIELRVGVTVLCRVWFRVLVGLDCELKKQLICVVLQDRVLGPACFSHEVETVCERLLSGHKVLVVECA